MSVFVFVNSASQMFNIITFYVYIDLKDTMAIKFREKMSELLPLNICTALK